jgi:hypothetical protein
MLFFWIKFLPRNDFFKILKLGDVEGFQSPGLYAWFSVCSQNTEG